MNLNNLFNKPKIIGLVANANEGKSNTLYYILDTLNKSFKFKVHTYGLRINYPNTITFNSVEEMEQIQNSLIMVDEMFSLFDLDNRKIKSQIENTIRLIFHNNNILLLCGLGENFKKFLAAKLHAVIIKKITFQDLINGSKLKQIILNYRGNERGSTMLNLSIDKAIIFDGLQYHNVKIPYYKEYDSKLKNVPILVPKIVLKKSVQKGGK